MIIILYLTIVVGKRYISNKFGESKARIVIPLGILLAISVPIAGYFLYFAPSFPGYYMLKDQPNEEDIIGKWTAMDVSLEWMEELGYPMSDPTITFLESGEFIASDYPDVLFFHRDRVLHEGTGRWRAIQGGIELTFDWLDPPWYPDPPLSGPTPCPGSSVPCEGLIRAFSLSGRTAPYTIMSYVGGELGPSIYYRRVGDHH